MLLIVQNSQMYHTCLSRINDIQNKFRHTQNKFRPNKILFDEIDDIFNFTIDFTLLISIK